MSEFQSLRRLRKLLPPLPRGWLGPGDDCAVLPWTASESLVISTDSLCEGVHFFSDVALRDLCHKALQVNLSDLAAKGARPLGIFLNLSLPPARQKDFPRLLKLFARACDREELALLGGDSTASRRDLVLTLTVLGRVPTRHLRLRSHARPGQILALVGEVGAAAAGLDVLRGHAQASWSPSLKKYLLRRHLRPRARLREGQFLARQSSVGAMMDVSDGLASDLRRLMEMSGCGFDVHLDALPFPPALRRSLVRQPEKLWRYGVAGGEDYSLLVTIEAAAFSRLAQKFHRDLAAPLIPIGRVLRPAELNFVADGRRVRTAFQGYDHFASSRD